MPASLLFRQGKAGERMTAMLFTQKLERVRKAQQEARARAEGRYRTEEDGNGPLWEPEEERIADELEKSDIPALMVSSFLTLFLPAVLILLVFAGFVMFLFGGF